MERIPEKEKMLRSVSNYISGFVTDQETSSKRVDDILGAMDKVDRKYFIEKNPYMDTALPIGHGQTISQPSTVGRVLMLAELEPGHDVLEIGFGSGWNACLAAYLVYPGKVISTEIVPELVDTARQKLERLHKHIDVSERLSKLEVKNENIFKNPHGKYDRIIATAGVSPDTFSKIKAVAKQLLKEKGIIVCPYQKGPMIIMRKSRDVITTEFTQEQYAFVPLII